MTLGIRLLLLLAAVGCGSPPPPAYVQANEQALAAQKRGQHAAAGKHYEHAATLATKPRDAEEARYRAADSFARAGDTARAVSLYESLASEQRGSPQRRARADFALADLLCKTGREVEGQARLVAAIRRSPGSGLARRALTNHLDYLRQQGGSEKVLAYLAVEGRTLSSTELGETIAYRRARELDEAGRAAEARDAYLACAASYPYPTGAYWDDALFRAAEKELGLGAPARALEHLRRLLLEQEAAVVTGSYERGRYAEAQLKIAEIYRDHLHDSLRARRELRKVWQAHPKSRLVDDALFQEALLARAAGDQAGTCAPLSILVEQLPDSRYAACAHLLCAGLGATPRACHDYIKRAASLP